MSNKKINSSDLKNLHVDTLGVRAGVRRTEFNEHSEAMFLTSSFCFDTAEAAAEGFAGPRESEFARSWQRPRLVLLINGHIRQTRFRHLDEFALIRKTLRKHFNLHGDGRSTHARDL